MSLTTDQNKRIAKELGLCWHEWEDEGIFERCSCGFATKFRSVMFDHCVEKNIPFDTRDGFFLIIETGPKQEWWREFILQDEKVFLLEGADINLWAIKQDFIGPALAVVLNEWLERRER